MKLSAVNLQASGNNQSLNIYVLSNLKISFSFHNVFKFWLNVIIQYIQVNLVFCKPLDVFLYKRRYSRFVNLCTGAVVQKAHTKNWQISINHSCHPLVSLQTLRDTKGWKLEAVGAWRSGVSSPRALCLSRAHCTAGGWTGGNSLQEVLNAAPMFRH